jgi:pimeloyl-ACP methyl ester carboxylesterase
VTQIEHRYAALPNGITLHYASAGSGALVLFVHGFPEFWYEWKDLLSEFGRDHLAVAPDMRGYNLSSKPPEVRDYRAKHLVEDLRLLMDHLGHERCVMVAHDWGGAVAWSFAALHPQRLDRLVIVNAPHPLTFARELRDNPAQRQASAYMNLFRSDKAERVLSENGCARLQRMTLDAWSGNGGTATDADRRAYLAAWTQAGALTGAGLAPLSQGGGRAGGSARAGSGGVSRARADPGDLGRARRGPPDGQPGRPRAARRAAAGGAHPGGFALGRA